MLGKYNSNLKSFESHKNKLEKQKIDLKQTYDKLNWKYNEMSEKLNSINVSVTTLDTQMSSSVENINRLKVNIDVLTSKKQELLANSSGTIKLDGKEKLNSFINQKNRKIKNSLQYRIK